MLDRFTTTGTGIGDMLWRFVHQSGGLAFGGSGWLVVLYPMLPWLGIMVLGNGVGSLFEKSFPAQTRKNYLMLVGIGSILLFAVLRWFDLYGESNYFFEAQDTFFKSVVSFLRISKYPPSLQFVLVTIGPSLIALALLENRRQRFLRILITFGRVPLFFYFAHILLLHLANLVLKATTAGPWYSSINNYQNYVDGLHQYMDFDLATVYLIWIGAIAVLYYPCLIFKKYKEGNQHKKWLSYL